MTPTTSSLSGSLGPPRRPRVFDASRTALIPLRPLTIGEILDGGFLIVQRNARLMVGLPLVVAGGAAAYVLLGVGLWVLLGNTTSRTAQLVLVILMGVIGLLILQQFLVWMTAVLSRVSLQTVLGEGFAPAPETATLRSALHLFWPVLGLSMLQGLALSVVQSALSVIYYAVILLLLASASLPQVVSDIVTVGFALIIYLAMAVGYGYLSLTVPALANESRRSPGWIGKPVKPTNVITAFDRAIRLVGRKNLPRVALIYAGLLAICVGLVVLIALGVVLMMFLFAQAMNADLLDLASNPWTIFAVSSVSVLLAMSAILAYAAAVQSLLYLDLRMRREALDLAMRFDCVAVPQPTAPPMVAQQWSPQPNPPGGGQ